MAKKTPTSATSAGAATAQPGKVTHLGSVTKTIHLRSGDPLPGEIAVYVLERGTAR